MIADAGTVCIRTTLSLSLSSLSSSFDALAVTLIWWAEHTNTTQCPNFGVGAISIRGAFGRAKATETRFGAPSTSLG